MTFTVQWTHEEEKNGYNIVVTHYSMDSTKINRIMIGRNIKSINAKVCISVHICSVNKPPICHP